MPQEITAGGGGAVRLAPDLNYIANKASTTANYREISGINPSLGYAVALELEGKFVISYLRFAFLTGGANIDVRLTVDGGIIWDSSTPSSSTALDLFGAISSSGVQEAMQCESSLILEVRKLDDSDITLIYLARPIL